VSRAGPGLLDTPPQAFTVRFVRKFWGLLVVFVAGVVVGVGPTVYSVLAGADRLGGFTEFALSDPAVVTYGVEPGAEVSVRLANYDFGTRRYEWELRLDADGSLVDAGNVLLAPATAAELSLLMPEVDPASDSTVWVSFHVLGLPQQLRWKLRASSPAPQVSEPAPSAEPVEPAAAAVDSPSAVDDAVGLDEGSDPMSADPSADVPVSPPGDVRSDPLPAEPVPASGAVPGSDPDGTVRDAHDGRVAIPVAPPPPVPRRIDSLDPLRPAPVYVEQVATLTVFFAPHSSKLSQTAFAEAAAFVSPALAGRNVRVFCDGYTQYGSGHGADLRLSTRRAENVCAALAALGLDAEFVPVGHGRADFQGDAARFVAVRLEYEVRPFPGAASLVPAHG